MPNPKRRHSRSRTRKRRSTYKIGDISMSVCPQCKSVKLPHRVCPNCGYYGNKQVIIKEEK
jgi:large subunit ribosomal protein L32